MTLKIIFTGKTSISYINEGIQEYLRRIKYYIKTEILIIPGIKNTRSLSSSQIKKKEGEAILSKIPASSLLILLDEKGKQLKSKELSVFFEKKIIEGRDICLLIGGAYGFSEDVYQRANEKLSLSKMTFSHQMVRIILLEQIYRAFTILKGEKYHHE